MGQKRGEDSTIIMTIKRRRNLNQTIDLVSTSEEAEIMPNGGRYDK